MPVLPRVVRCPAADPRHEITLEFHDKRRLQDRVARIRTGVAYSMVPVIRTRHVLGNVEYWQGDDSEVRARASFIIDALFDDKHRVLSGWVGYSLVKELDAWNIGSLMCERNVNGSLGERRAA